MPAQAVDPEKHISQYAHAAWRIQDGFFNGSPTVLVQTSDGYLWLGTRSELLRFDGVRFVPWSTGHGERLPSSQVRDLLAARDGSLWIATAAGVSRWKNQTLTNYPSVAGGVGVLLEDRQGKIWLGQLAPPAESGPLCQVLESTIRCLGVTDGVPDFGMVNAVIEDPRGNIWVGGNTTLLRWTRVSQTAYRPSGLKTNSAAGVVGLASTPEGTIWVGIAGSGPGLGLQQLVQGRWRAFKTPQLDGSTLNVGALHLDREGSLWVGTSDRGIYRLHGDNVDHFDSTSGLSSDLVQAIREDREGNVWVTTSQGIDRFSDTPVISFSTNEGLCATEVDGIVASRDGSIWVGGSGSLSHLRNGRVSCVRTGKGLPGSQVTSLLEDHAGRLWVGIDNDLWLYEDGLFRRITRPDGRAIGFVTGIDQDADDIVWIAANGPPRTVMRIEGLAVREEIHEPQMPRRVAADPTGGIWLGLVNGDLAHYRDGKVATYRFAHGNSALLQQLLPLSDGSVLAATSYGLIGWQNGKQMTLTAKNGLPCDELNAITFDDQGNLWLFMNCALGELTSSDLQMWKSNPDINLSIRRFDVLDGVRTGSAPFNGATKAPDGRLWFANTYVVETIDPSHRRRNSVLPPVHIEQVIADRKNYPTAGGVHLPPLTRDLEIDYVGLSFTAPQRVLFRYRLEGRDPAWQEPGTRRQAFYSDLRPGTYRFHVIASNNDGLWNEEGAALDFVVDPAWYQTKTFLVLFLMMGTLAVWAAFRLRIRQVARALNARFDERLAERTRMARDLHDTLLQTVQGSRMVADNALSQPADPDGMRRAMEQVSIWLGQASTEGRAAVNSLRMSTTERNDLAEAFRRAIEDCGRHAAIQASLSVTGDTRDMHPVVRDEVYRIGYEAIRNARTHSCGSRLEVGLTYAHDLIVSVADNGVGIDPSISHAGKEGHFGLGGMRERAARIGAKLTIVSSANSGTEIVLTVPGRVIFRQPPGALFDRIRSHFARRSDTGV